MRYVLDASVALKFVRWVTLPSGNINLDGDIVLILSGRNVDGAAFRSWIDLCQSSTG